MEERWGRRYFYVANISLLLNIKRSISIISFCDIKQSPCCLFSKVIQF